MTLAARFCRFVASFHRERDHPITADEAFETLQRRQRVIAYVQSAFFLWLALVALLSTCSAHAQRLRPAPRVPTAPVLLPASEWSEATLIVPQSAELFGAVPWFPPVRVTVRTEIDVEDCQVQTYAFSGDLAPYEPALNSFKPRRFLFVPVCIPARKIDGSTYLLPGNTACWRVTVQNMQFAAPSEIADVRQCEVFGGNAIPNNMNRALVRR